MNTLMCKTGCIWSGTILGAIIARVTKSLLPIVAISYCALSHAQQDCGSAMQQLQYYNQQVEQMGYQYVQQGIPQYCQPYGQMYGPMGYQQCFQKVYHQLNQGWYLPQKQRIASMYNQLMAQCNGNNQMPPPGPDGDVGDGGDLPDGGIDKNKQATIKIPTTPNGFRPRQ